MKWNDEALMLEWTPTLGLGVQGWNFKKEDNSGILDKNILCFFLSAITSTGIALLTQAEEPMILATTVTLLFHVRGWQDSHRERKMCPKSIKACLPFVWCSISKGMDSCHKSNQSDQENTESPEEIRHEAVLLWELFCLFACFTFA